MNHQEYINELARQSAQKQANLNKKAAANIVKGFAQGGPVGAIVAGVKAAREKGKNLRNSAKEMDSAMLEQGKMANEELMSTKVKIRCYFIHSKFKWILKWSSLFKRC